MFYPAHLNLQNRKCLIVGAGPVAERKVISLLRSGGEVTLISPEATKPLENLAQIDQIRWRKRQFQSGDTEGMFLVYAATDQPEINTQVFKEAYEAHGIRLINVVDFIPECTFAAASVVTCGDLIISISTSGKSPAMAKRIREFLEAKLRMAEERSRNQRFPYPVYFLLENRSCVIVSDGRAMSGEVARRVDLLRRCGASVEQTPPTDDNCHRLSDAFFVCLERESAAFAPTQIQLIEYLSHPEAGTFTTPLLIVQGELVMSAAAGNEIEKEQDKAKRVQATLVSQFENKGYAEFIDFLGDLRPLVMDAIPTQERRQRFFDDLIDRIPGHREQRCCLGFAHADCSIECPFNWIRSGQIARARQYALQQIHEFATRTPLNPES